MNQLKKCIDQINSQKQEKALSYTNLIQIIKSNEGQIAQNQLKSIQASILLAFMSKRIRRLSNNEFYKFLEQFIVHVYNKKSQMQILIYQLIPSLLTRYIQSIQLKNQSLENCIRAIYNNEYVHFNKNLISRQLLMSKSGQIGNLYKQHFLNPIKTIIQPAHLNEINKQDQINSSNRVAVKSVLLLSLFNNLEKLTEKTVLSYLWMVYVYCGGTEQEQQSGVSLYLLQKKNMFSIFKLYMSIEQMSIILLTLYELSMQRKKNKFQILSAINMIHKKAANESMFKLSEVAQSTIHLLQDQYSQAFS